MKKFNEKYNLFFVISIVIALCVLGSWILPETIFNNGALIDLNGTALDKVSFIGLGDAVERIGFFDLIIYALSPLRYFADVFVFLFVVSGFYNFVGSIEAYQNLTGGIAKKFEKCGFAFVAISTLVFAVLASVFTSYFALFAIIPFALSILAKLKVDKITAVIATFGGALIGILANTYSTSIAGIMANSSVLGIPFGNEFFIVLCLGVVAYLALMGFTFFRMTKKSGEAFVDPYAPSEKAKAVKSVKATNKVSSVPMVVVLILLFVTIVLGFISWNSSFGVTAFDTAHTDAMDMVVFKDGNGTGGFRILSHLLGNHAGNRDVTIQAFGNFDLFIGAALMIITAFIVKVLYRVPLGHAFDSFKEGFKKVIKTALTIMLIYVVLEFAAFFPRISSVASWIYGGVAPTGVNALQLFSSGVVTSIFTVDFQYLAGTIGSVFALYGDAGVAGIIMQASYGFAMFIAPTSILLMAGLSIANVKYTEWFKAIWKYLVILLAIIAALILFVTM